ncbi:ph-response sensor protein [Teratosphaeriaceae sp. CCFEE 6253]|nr:ph-response sensor protein [Teratosphaeriaceae sp. CCFEE 6253]
MPSSGDRAPAASLSTPLSGRRLISRLASPFTSKSRTIADFYIDVEDPHKQYSPGDLVKGSVRLRVTKPTRVTHIVVSLHGFVQVYRNPGSPGEGFRANSGYTGTGRGKKSGEYFGNGFASLFEDEVVLCGDGRLADGSYQFNFELQFPDTDLPSSIDFERGTISYMVTTTMTRPTTMSPTMNYDHKVYLVERIDISPIFPPKPRTITLEPLLSRTRARQQARRLVDSSSRRTGSNLQSEPDRDSVVPSVHTDGDTPLSPVPSEISFDSIGSSNGRTSQPDSTRPSPSGAGGSDGSKTTTGRSSGSYKTISATVESLTGGCLRGDNVNIRVTVNHNKPIRSLYGVIVTLYRQARVDLHPAIPLGPMEEGTKKRFEDYYPKSVTGLGGLSLSGAGSSHLFRKDLAQAVVPLYVEPAGLTADVHAKVRVPDETFPTISTVPGAMISFKYFAEVVVDIQGKLSGQDRSVGGLNLSNPRPPIVALDAGEPGGAAPLGSGIIDTVPIRRDKGVITCTFEIVVGTRDSGRRKGKRRAEESAVESEPAQAGAGRNAEAGPNGASAEGSRQWANGVVSEQRPWHLYQEAHPYDRPPDHLPPGIMEQEERRGYDGYPPAVPLPPMPDESAMSEKDRLRQHEARLLPSAPPGVPDEETGAGADGAATAPRIEDELAAAGPSSAFFPNGIHAGFPGFPASAAAYGTVGAPTPDAGPSAPAYEQHVEAGPAAQLTAAPGRDDDKQDLHRQRLALAASSPPGDEDAEGDGEAATAAAAGSMPSAPTAEMADLHGVHGFDSHDDAVGGAELPRYER